jgi:tetratricopeptide (TPR) repeat protein
MKNSLRMTCVAFMACLSAAVLSHASTSTFEIKITGDDKNNGDALPSALIKGAEEAYSVNKKGIDELEKGELDSAMAYFSKASSMLPVYVDAENNRGVVHFRKGNVPTAKLIWQSVVAKDPTYAVAFYNLGVIDFYDKNYGPALDYFHKAITIQKKFIEALVMLGRTELSLGKKKEACEHFREGYKIDRDRTDVGLYLAFGLISAGDTGQAQSVLVKLKHSAEALKMLGQIESSRGNFAAASTYFSEAISGGALPDLLIELAWTQLDAKKYKDALSSVRAYAGKVKVMAADAYIIGGIASKESSDLDGSRVYFEKGVAVYPSDPILRFNLGQIYFLKKQYDRAETTWKTLPDTAADPSLYYMKALSAKQRGDLGLAEQLIKSALKLDQRAEYLDFLGVVLYANGRKDEALTQFKKALAVDPDLRSAQLNSALLSESKDGLDAAAETMAGEYAGCTDQCNDKAVQLSIIYYHQGKVDKALGVLEKIPEGKKDLRVLRHCALYLRQMREWDKAIAVLEKASRDFVLDEKLACELADDYIMAGHYAKAVETLKNVLSTWGENPWRLYYQLGYACFQQNDMEKAAQYFQQSLKSKPDNVAAQGLLALVYNMQGNTQMARSLWEKNLHEDPTNPVILINLGLSLEKEGRFQEALDHYTRAHILMPDDNTLMINIGNVYEGLDRPVDAQNAYAAALNSPKKNLAAFDIFLLARKSHNQARAKEMFSLLSGEFPASVYTRRAQAEMLFEEGDSARGLAVLELLPEKDPVDWYTMARIYAAKKEYKKTSQCLDMLPKEPFWDKARVDIDVQKAYASGDYSLAYSLLEGLHDTAFSVQYNTGLAAFQAKKYAEALSLAEALVKKAKGKDRADVCRLAGNADFGLKQWKKAKEWYEQLAGMEGNDPIVHYNCAVASYNLGEIDIAWGYYKKALEMNPALSNKDIENRYAAVHPANRVDTAAADSLDALYNDAVALQREEKNAEAEQIYKKILDKKAFYPRAWNNLGTIYSARGDLRQAEECFLKSVEKQHDIPEAYANLVTVYIAMDSLGAARGWIIKGLGHNPDSDVLNELDARVKDLVKNGRKKKKVKHEVPE